MTAKVRKAILDVIQAMTYDVDMAPACRVNYKRKLQAIADLFESIDASEDKNIQIRDCGNDAREIEVMDGGAGDGPEGKCCGALRVEIDRLQEDLDLERQRSSESSKMAFEKIQQHLDKKRVERDELKKGVLEFLNQCQNSDKASQRNKICSQLSSVSKPKPGFRPGIENSAEQASKFEDMNLLSYFDSHKKENRSPNYGFSRASPSKPLIGDLLPPRIVESAEKKVLKKNFLTFKESINQREKTSEKKPQKSFVSDLDLPDFTMDCLTNRDIDPCRIADQYEVNDSCYRPLLHINEDDVNNARSLPISLKGSSTFQ